MSAPFAGTTTAPLATSRPQASVQRVSGQPSAQAEPQRRAGLGPGTVATLAGAEALLLGVGGGVIVYARRRRAAER